MFIVPGVQLTNRRGAVSLPILLLKLASFPFRLRSISKSAQGFIRGTGAGFILSCWHYSFALMLSTALAHKTKVIHIAPQFDLRVDATPSSGVVESIWRGSLLALRDAFQATGHCVAIGPKALDANAGAALAECLPPILQPPPLWTQPPTGTPKLVLCYFLSTDAAQKLVDAVKCLQNEEQGCTDAAFHCFSDPPLQVCGEVASFVVPHLKSKIEFRKLFEVCDSVICSSGNETVWESICRGVPILTIPTLGHAEQILNAHKHAEHFPKLVRAEKEVSAESLRWLLAHKISDCPEAAQSSSDLRKAVASFPTTLRGILDRLLKDIVDLSVSHSSAVDLD